MYLGVKIQVKGLPKYPLDQYIHSDWSVKSQHFEDGWRSRSKYTIMVDIPSDGHAWLPHNIVNRSPIVSFSYSITTDCHQIYQWHALKSVQSFVVPQWVSHNQETISVIKLKATICSLNSAKNVQSQLNFLAGIQIGK